MTGSRTRTCVIWRQKKKKKRLKLESFPSTELRSSDYPLNQWRHRTIENFSFYNMSIVFIITFLVHIRNKKLQKYWRIIFLPFFYAIESRRVTQSNWAQILSQFHFVCFSLGANVHYWRSAYSTKVIDWKVYSRSDKSKSLNSNFNSVSFCLTWLTR